MIPFSKFKETDIYDRIAAWSAKNKKRMFQQAIRFAPLGAAISEGLRNELTPELITIIVTQLASFFLDVLDLDDTQVVAWIWEKILGNFAWLKNQVEKLIRGSKVEHPVLGTYDTDVPHIDVTGFSAYEDSVADCWKEEQSGPSGSGLGHLVIALISLVLGLFDKTFSFTVRCSKALTNGVKNADSIGKLWDDLKGFLGIGSKEEMAAMEMMVETSKQVERFNTMPLAQAYHEYTKMTDLKAEITKLIPTYSALFKGKPKGESAVRLFTSNLNRLTKTIENTGRIVNDLKKIRPIPVCRHFYGPPGHGKTHFIENDLSPKLLEKLDLETTQPFFTLGPAVKYAPPYLEQPIAVLDEFLAMRDEDARLPHFNSMATGGPVLMDGAAVEQKYQTPRYRFLFTLSNFEDFQPPAQSPFAGMKEAVNSRLNKVYVHWKDYDASKPRTAQKEGRKLCFHNTPHGASYVNHLTASNTSCPDNNIITEEDLIDEMVREYKKLDEMFKAKIAASEKLLQSGDHCVHRVPVVLMHGKTDVGKTSTAAQLGAEFAKQGYTIGSDHSHDITILDDYLPEREAEYCQIFDRKKSGLIITTANLRFNKVIRRRTTEMHSRTLTRTPLKGLLKGTDGVSVESDNPGLEIKVSQFQKLHERGRGPMSFDDLFRACQDLAGLPGKHLELTFSDEEPETADIVIGFEDPHDLRKYKLATHGVVLGKDFSIKSAERMASLLSIGDTSDAIFPALRTIRNVTMARKRDVTIKATIGDDLLVFFMKGGRWYYCMDRVLRNQLITKYRTDARDPVFVNPFWLAIAKYENGGESKPGIMEEAVQAYYNDTWAAFFKSSKGKIIKAFCAVVLGALAVTAAGVYITRRRKKKKDEKEGEGKPTGLTAESFEKFINSEPKARVLINRIAKNESLDDYWTKHGRVTRGLNRQRNWSEDELAHAQRLWELKHGAADGPEWESVQTTDAMAEALMNNDIKSQFNACVDLVTPNLCTVACGTMSNFGIMIGGRFGMTVAHLFFDSETGKLGRKAQVQTSKGKFSAEACKIMLSSEICLFKVTDKVFNDFKDITHCFAKAEYIDRATTGAIVIPRMMKDKMAYDYHHGVMDFDLAGENSLNHGRTMRKNFVTLNYPSDQAITAKGFCGLPYIATNLSDGVSLITGIHAMGTVRGRTIWGACITQELIRAATKSAESGDLPAFKEVDIKGKVYRTPTKIAEKMVDIGVEAILPENDRIHELGKGSIFFQGHSGGNTFKLLPVPFEKNPSKIPGITAELPRETIEKMPLNHQGKPDRGLAQMNKMAIREKPVDAKIIKHLWQEYYPFLRSFFEEDGAVRVLNTHEVINGVSHGPLDKIHGLDMSKSMGYSLKKAFGKSKKKDIFIQDKAGQYYFKHDSPAVIEFFKWIDDIEKNPDKEHFFPCTATLKDELLPTHKVMGSGKIRVFSNVDFVELFMTKKYLGFAVGTMQKWLFQGSTFTAGLDPMMDFHILYKKLDDHPYYVTFDYSGWDKTLNRECQALFLDMMRAIVSEHYSPEDFKRADWCLRRLLDRLEVYNGVLYEIIGSISSGVYWTNFENSGANEIVILVVVVTLHKREYGRYPTMQEMLDNMVWYTHGDDVITSISKLWIKWLNYFTIKKILKEELGMTITPGNKDGIEREHEPREETTFLSRYPRNIRGHTLGALKKESIVQQLNYTRNTDNEILREQFENILHEAALWDSEFFDEVASCIKANAKKLQIKRMIVGSQDSYIEKVFIRGELSRTSTPARGSENKISEQLSRDTPEMQSKETIGFSITCPQCDFQSKDYEEANMHRVEQHDHDKKPVVMTIKADDEKAFCEAILNGLTPFDTDIAVSHADTHRGAIQLVGRALVGKSYPHHDLSKYSKEELPGYTLRFGYHLDGPTWEKALQHHYDHNDHHPQFHKGEMMPAKCLEEAVVDACACIWERVHKGKEAPVNVLRGYLEGLNPDNPFMKPFGENVPRLKEMAEKILANIVDQLPDDPVLECPARGCGVKTTTTIKLVRHVENSHPGTPCPSCNRLKTHSGSCAAFSLYVCTECSYTNADIRKMANHFKSAHPKREFKARCIKKENQSGGAGIEAAVGGMTPIGALAPLAVAGVPGIPSMAPAMLGYASDIYDVAHRFTLQEIVSVPDTSPSGTQIFTRTYGFSSSMNTAAALLASHHKYMHGPMEFKVTAYGASNITGSLIVGVVPPGAPPSPSVAQLMAYGNFAELACNSQSSCTLELNHADASFRPREINAGAPVDMPRLFCLVKDQLSNKIGTGATTLNLHIDARLGPDAGFTFYNPTIDGFAAAGEEELCQATRDIYLSDLAVNGLQPFAFIDGERLINSSGSIVANYGNWEFPDAARLTHSGTGAIAERTFSKNMRDYHYDNDYAHANGGVWRDGSDGKWINQPIDYHDLIEMREDPTEEFRIYADYFANLLPLDLVSGPGGDYEVNTNFCCTNGSSIYRHYYTNPTPNEPLSTEEVKNKIEAELVRSVEAFLIQDLSRYSATPAGARRFTISTQGVVSVNAAIEQKLPVQQKSIAHDKLVERCLQIGRGRSLRFRMKSGTVEVAEIMFHYPSRDFLITTPLDYAYLTDDVSFTGFETVADSYVPPAQAMNGSWSNLTYTSTAARDNINERARVIRANSYAKELQSGGLLAGAALGGSAMGGFFGGSHQRQRQRWFTDNAEDIINVNQAFRREMQTRGFVGEMAIQAFNARLLNDLMTNKARLGNANLQTTANSATMGTNINPEVDSQNRVVQQTPGGVSFVQEWKRGPTEERPKSADVFQQTNWGPAEVIRVKQNTAKPNMVSAGTQLDDDSTGLEPPAKAPVSVSVQNSPPPIRDVNRGPTMVNGSAISNEGDLTVIDDDEMRS